MIKAVIFDMDGLMYATEPMIEACWKKVAKHTRITLTEQTLSALRCRNSEDRQKYLTGIFGDRMDYERLEKQMFKELHTQIIESGLPQKEGLWELLIYLKRNDYKLAVQTTNSADTAGWYLELSGCTRFFDAVISGEIAGKGKPEPDVFLKAAGFLGVGPDECLVLEDSPAGIIAAHRAGCLPVMIPDMDAPTRGAEALAGAILGSLDDVIGFIRQNPHLPEQLWPPVRNVVFDLGGVVVGFDPREYLRRRFGHKELEDFLYTTVFGSRMWRDIDAGLIERDNAQRQMLEKARKQGCLFEMQTVLDEWNSMLVTKEDTVALIKKLKQKGCGVYYLSNIAPDTFEMLRQRGLMDIFDGGVASFENHLMKPDEEIFKDFLRKYDVRPSETIFFDDTTENADAATRLGMIGLYFHSAALAEKNLEGYRVL